MATKVAKENKDTPEDTSAVKLNNVGRHLKKERLALKLSLDDVAERLKLRKDYVKAIETNTLSDLPEEIYATGFVRAYAQLVQLDANQITKAFQEDYKNSNLELTKEDTALNVITPHQKTPNFALVLSLILLVGLGVIGYYAMRPNDAPPEGDTPQVIETLTISEEGTPPDEAMSPGTSETNDAPTLPSTAPLSEDIQTPPPAA